MFDEMIDTLGGLGFGTLVADSAEDIDTWPSFNSLFKLPALYDIKDELTDEVLIEDLDFTTTVKIIKLFDIDRTQFLLTTFVEDFLADEGYFCFTNYDDRALIAEEK